MVGVWGRRLYFFLILFLILESLGVGRVEVNVFLEKVIFVV